MTKPENDSRMSFSLEVLERIDTTCAEFERALQHDIWPPIEDFLADVTGEERSQLLFELLLLEFTYRNRDTAELDFEEYRVRFPEHLEAVERAIDRFCGKTSNDGASQPHWHRDSVVRRRQADVQLPDGYELLDEIARGGQGIVYRARQISCDRIVAVKMLLKMWGRADDAIERFDREARITAHLHHPNIVTVYDVGNHNGQPFITMEYVDGRNLSDLVKTAPLPAKRAAYYVHVAARAIQVAHEQGIMHRDLKPSNILIDKGNRVRVSDFGLAKLLDDGSSLTESGHIIGTASYMSPEQASGRSAKVGPQSDVYSLGAVLYELLTSRPPFAASTLLETIQQVQSQPPVPPRALNSRIPADLEAVCLKCLEKESGNRYATARELSEDLKRHLHEQRTKARPTGAVGNFRKWTKQRAEKKAAWTVVVGLALLLGFVFGGPPPPSPPDPQPPQDVEVRLDIDDPNIEMGDGNTRITPEDDGSTITLKPGEYSFYVRYNGKEREAIEFELIEGMKPTLSVKQSERTTTIKLDKYVLSEFPIPVPPVDPPFVPEDVITHGKIPIAEGGQVILTGSMWHPALDEGKDISYKITLTALEMEVVDGLDHRWIEVEVLSWNEDSSLPHRESACLLVDVDPSHFKVAHGLVFVGDYTSDDALVVRFDQFVDGIAERYKARNENVPPHRLAVRDVLVMLFDAKVETSQNVFRLLRQKLSNSRVEQGQPIKEEQDQISKTFSGCRIVTSGPGEQPDGVESVDYRLVFNQGEVPFEWVEASIKYETEDETIFFAELDLDTTKQELARPREFPLKQSIPRKVSTRSFYPPLPNDGGWVSITGYLKKGRAKMDYKVLLRAVGTAKGKNGKKLRWIEVETHVDDHWERGRLLIDEDEYNRSRVFEVETGWVWFEVGTENYTVPWKAEEDLLTKAIGTVRVKGVPAKRLAVRDVLALLFGAPVKTSDPMTTHLRRIIDGALTFRTSGEATYDHKGEDIVCKSFTPNADGVPGKMPKGPAAVGVDYTILQSSKIPFVWVSVDLKLHGSADFEASLNLDNYGNDAVGAFPDDVQLRVRAARTEELRIRNDPVERQAWGAFGSAKRIERRHGKARAFNNYQEVVADYPGTRAAGQAEAWLQRNKRFDPRNYKP